MRATPGDGQSLSSTRPANRTTRQVSQALLGQVTDMSLEVRRVAVWDRSQLLAALRTSLAATVAQAADTSQRGGQNRRVAERGALFGLTTETIASLMGQAG